MQVLPNVIRRFRSSFNVNFLTKNLKFGFVHNSLSFPYVFIIFKCHENTTDSCVILFILNSIDLMFKLKDFTWVFVSNSLTSVSQQLDHFLIIKDQISSSDFNLIFFIENCYLMSDPISKLFTSWTLNLIRLIKHSIKHTTLFFTHREIQSVIRRCHIVLIVTNG